MEKLICAFCGNEKEEISFYIGASKPEDPDWTMVEGTGKTTCPDCYSQAMEEAREIINKL